MTAQHSYFTARLRERTDDELRTLLTARPDLMYPVPSDLTALADRAAAPASVARALDRLNKLDLQVVEVLAALPNPPTRDQLLSALGGREDGPRKAVEEAVNRLVRLALVGETATVRVVSGAAQVINRRAGLGPLVADAFREYPANRLAGLVADLGDERPEIAADPDFARRVLTAQLSTPERVRELLAEAGPEAAAALRRLTWGPPSGRLAGARREVRTATARSPVEQLLSRGLLAAVDDRTVVLPREVALVLREGRVFRSVDPQPPPLDGRRRDPELVDRTAGGQAFAATRAVEKLLELCGFDAPGVLRAGGLAARDLRHVARVLEVEVWVAALYVEVARAAGLLAASGAGGGEWLPTRAYDRWRGKPAAQRWAALAAAWLATNRVPGLVGERDERDKPLNALSAGLDRAHAAELRDRVLQVLAEAAESSVDAEAVRAQLLWRCPRLAGRLAAGMAEWTLREAEAMGVTGLGALSTPGRAVWAGYTESAAEAVEPLLPEPVDHVLLQADLTAVAPGPLTQHLLSEMELAADVESTGGATVYRFTEASVRRAMDAGRTADELLETLERHSRTPVPQPLRYLVADVARRHGRVRVGAASAYLRCDDPATLNELLADRRAAPLRLFRLAPTVLASRASRAELLDGLRSLGYAPVVEAPGGATVITRPDARRTEGRWTEPAGSAGLAGLAGSAGSATPPEPDRAEVTAAIRALRAGEQARAQAGGRHGDGDGDGDGPPRSSTTATMDALRRAVADGRRMWIGFVDAQGRPAGRIVDPVRVESGFLTAYDTTRASVHRFALHRITGATPAEQQSAPPQSHS